MDSYLTPFVFEELLHRLVLTLEHENVGSAFTRVDDTLRASSMVIQRPLLPPKINVPAQVISAARRRN